MKKFAKLWNAVKIPLLAILCSLVVGGVIIAVMAGFGVCFAVRRKIRNIY